MKKKVLFELLVLIMCLTLVGCGSSEKKSNKETNSGNIQGSDEKGANLDNVTEGNYAKVMKDNYGIEPIYGNGWTILEVKSPNKVNNLRVNYKTPKDIDSNEWTKKYFDATLAISTDGIYGVEMDFNTGALSKGPKLSDFDSYISGGYTGWYYYWNNRQIQINPSIYAGDALITFTFTE